MYNKKNFKLFGFTSTVILMLVMINGCKPKCKTTTVRSCPLLSEAKNVGSKAQPLLPKIFLDLEKTATGSYLGSSVRGIKWSPDGRLLTFLKTGENNLTELWEWDFTSRTLKVLVRTKNIISNVKESDVEKAARERKRISQQGIVSYFWSPNSQKIMFPLSGDLYLYDIKKHTTNRLSNDKDPELNPVFSPDGKNIAWVKRGNIEVLNIKTGKIKKITKGATKTKYFGLAEFVAQEEMGRYRGYWWSPDSKKICFIEVDESKVPIRKRLDINDNGFKIISQRYPSAGKNNAKVRVAISSIKKPSPKWLVLGKYEYIPRVQWVNSHEVSIQTQTRNQRILNLNVCSAKNGKCSVIQTKADTQWVELDDNLRFIEGGKRVIWTNENSNQNSIVQKRPYRNRYYRSKVTGPSTALFIATRATKAPLINIETIRIPYGYSFHRLLKVNEKKGTIYFSAYGNQGKSNHLFSYVYKTTKGAIKGRIKNLTPHNSYHSFVISPDSKKFLDKYSNVQTQGIMAIKNISGSMIALIPPLKKIDPVILRLPKPQFVSVPVTGKNVFLNGLLFKPRPSVQYNKKYPAIIFVYGGPHGHMVRFNASKYNLWSQYLAERGFYVLVVDGRGGLYRDKRFAKAPYGQFGKFEVEDSVAAARFLKNYSTIDSNRIGIWGWSYGGYTVLASLLNTQGVFAAGLSVAPPTDWTLYDTHYTERYLGVNTSSAFYKNSLITPEKLTKLSSPLMVIHGMSDDNVLLLNSLRIIKGMQDKVIPFELMLYPGKAHSLWGVKTRSHLLSQITSFFTKHLNP